MTSAAVASAAGPARAPSGTPLSDALQRTRQTRALVEGLVADPAQLGPVFTPIGRIDGSEQPVDSTRLGWRASGRGLAGTPLSDMRTLLTQARRLGLTERLDWAFRCHTFDVAVAAGMDGELHLSPKPETFGSPCPPRLAVSFLRGRRSLAVVAELHENAFLDIRALLGAVEQMRRWGWQFAYADLTGTTAEARAIELVAAILPAYQHVDAHRGSTGALHEVAREHGASLLAVGVDSTEDLERARSAGAVWGRGALVGPPSSVPE